MLTEISIGIFLTIINGVLAMSELAVVSSRPVGLKRLAEQGNKGATIAIRLADDPGRLLSTVQIGITLVSVLSGAFSGARSAHGLPDGFRCRACPKRWPMDLVSVPWSSPSPISF